MGFGIRDIRIWAKTRKTTGTWVLEASGRNEITRDVTVGLEVSNSNSNSVEVATSVRGSISGHLSMIPIAGSASYEVTHSSSESNT
jgi:hypothetical protein